MMHMFFDWSADIGDFLIPGLTINGVPSLVLLCAILFLFCITFEGMKVHQARSRARAARESQRAHSTAPSETANLLTDHRSTGAGNQQLFAQRFAKMFSDATFFMMHNLFTFLLMLTVMGYNGFVFITVVLGLGFGYFLFGHLSMKTNMENIQARQTSVVCGARSATGPIAGGSGVSTINPSCSSSSQLQAVVAEPSQEQRDSSSSEPEASNISRL